MKHKLRKEKWVRRVDWLKEKAQALCKVDPDLVWTGVAIYLIFRTQFFWRFFNCVNEYLKAGILVCMGVLSVILFFGGFYQPYIRRERRDIDVTHP